MLFAMKTKNKRKRGYVRMYVPFLWLGKHEAVLALEKGKGELDLFRFEPRADSLLAL